MNPAPIVEMHSISKRFGQVQANQDVDFTLLRGEIHAIVGENGAGKSTLMKILYGLYESDSGSIVVDGKKVSIPSPKKAMQLGLGMIQQHFTLIPVFTALQNIILGNEKQKYGTFLDYKKSESDIVELMEQLGFNVPLHTPIETLPIGAQQHTEILKVFYHGAEILIMDEPTAVLAPQEVEGLFNCMLGLKSKGNSIIIITHKLEEVMAIADSVTVMRRGKMVGSYNKNETNVNQLAELILGEPVIHTPLDRKDIIRDKPILRVENVSVISNSNKPVLSNINLDVFPGEIVGIAGVEGNGQTELVEILSGLTPVDSGTITLNGESITNCSTAELRQKNIVHLPADRHRHGISLNSRIDENFIIGKHRNRLFSRNELLQMKNINQYSKNALHKYQIRFGDISDPIKTLSGGNQQKVVVARELYGDPTLVVSAHPTRGLDIHAARFVHSRLIQTRNRAKGIILVSSELDELILLSDRIVVMYNGTFVGTVTPTMDDNSNELQEKEKQKLGALMLGISIEE
ncbi:ABC transporter ATP-binding protein [Candidatus Poribacteria bacterium]|nr:ABC transporter ATP-binding protein [Candidatus Poribacteria bacterium]